jgi:hypothetical protein
MARAFPGGKPLQFEKYDNYVTSKEGWDVVKKYIPENLKIWCPFYHGGEVEDYFNYGNIIHANKDFFTWQPEEDWDIICDNPPYSIKKNVIKRCVELGKPFALLMPMDTMERQYFRSYIIDNPEIRFSIVIPRNRIKFLKDGKFAGSNPTITLWYLFNILEGDKNLIFED